MRILVLSKRQYTNLDLIDDRFGRLRELPLALAAAGHEVTGICLSYRFRNEGRLDDIEKNAQVIWHALNVKRLLPWGSKSYWHTINEIGKCFHPDLVWACSDAIHAILGVHIAKKLGASLIIDLYDNFESFSVTRIPGMTSAFRRALRQADGITCVSHPLSRYVHETSSCKCPIEVIENAVPEGIFYPMDRASCRRELGLPQDGLFIGTAGAISKSRGIETLFNAFEILAQERADVHLVLAGSCDKGLTLPKSSRLHNFGMLTPPKVPVVLSALNVSVICNRESEFGKYCFPQKFYEAVACGVPVVAAATGSMLELLKDRPEYLYEPDNVDSLLTVLRHQINNAVALPAEAPTWSMLEKRLEDFFRACIKANHQ
jgi:glycosyltransferase involved in cell wall biosynthesis